MPCALMNEGPRAGSVARRLASPCAVLVRLLRLRSAPTSQSHARVPSSKEPSNPPAKRYVSNSLFVVRGTSHKRRRNRVSTPGVGLKTLSADNGVPNEDD